MNLRRMKNLLSIVLLLAAAAGLVGCATGEPPTAAQLQQQQVTAARTNSPPRLPRETEEKILALNPEHVTERDIREVLTPAPAPRLIMLSGGLLPVQVAMKSFSKFIIGMGYPEWCARDPMDGAYSHSSYRDSGKIAGLIAAYYEKEGLRPMLLGHSLGGIQAVKVLQTMSGNSGPPPVVWNPLTEKPEARHAIIDPLTGHSRAITNLQVCYATTLALPRQGGGGEKHCRWINCRAVHTWAWSISVSTSSCGIRFTRR